MSTDRSSHRPSFSAAGLSGSRRHFGDAVGIAHRGMASFSRVRVPAWAFAAARPPSEAPSLSAITGLPAARAALRVYFTRPGGRKLAHYGRARGHAAVRCPLRADCAAAPTGTPDANALPGQPALRPLAGGILGRPPINCSAAPCRARPWSMRSPRERWSRRAASPRPTRGQGSQRCPCGKSNSFHFSLNAVPPMVQMAAGHCHTLITSSALDRARTSSGLRGTQPIRLEQKFEFHG